MWDTGSLGEGVILIMVALSNIWTNFVQLEAGHPYFFAKVWHLPFFTSSHAPIVLEVDIVPYNPNRIWLKRFERWWLEQSHIFSVVWDFWELQVMGNGLQGHSMADLVEELHIWARVKCPNFKHDINRLLDE